MFVLGHAGLSVGAVHALDRRADLRWVPFFGLLPDLVDKPIGFLVPAFANGWSRSIGHSLLGLAVFSAIAVALAKRRAWIAILPFALHFVLDRMWLEQDRVILLWPFASVALPPHEPPYAHWWDRFAEPWQFWGEISGLGVFVAIGLRGQLWRPGTARKFLASGEISSAAVAHAADAG